MDLLSYLHLLMYIFFGVYILIFQKKTSLDFWYVIVFLLINVQWVFLKGECIITYVYMKSKDPNYKLGENPTNNSDLEDLLQIPRSTLDAVTWSILIFYIFNVFVILRRWNINIILILIVVTSYILYLVSFRLDHINLPMHIYYGILHVVLYIIFLCIWIKNVEKRI